MLFTLTNKSEKMLLFSLTGFCLVAAVCGCFSSSGSKRRFSQKMEYQCTNPSVGGGHNAFLFQRTLHCALFSLTYEGEHRRRREVDLSYKNVTESMVYLTARASFLSSALTSEITNITIHAGRGYGHATNVAIDNVIPVPVPDEGSLNANEVIKSFGNPENLAIVFEMDEDVDGNEMITLKADTPTENTSQLRFRRAAFPRSKVCRSCGRGRDVRPIPTKSPRTTHSTTTTWTTKTTLNDVTRQPLVDKDSVKTSTTTRAPSTTTRSPSTTAAAPAIVTKKPTVSPYTTARSTTRNSFDEKNVTSPKISTTTPRRLNVTNAVDTAKQADGSNSTKQRSKMDDSLSTGWNKDGIYENNADHANSGNTRTTESENHEKVQKQEQSHTGRSSNGKELATADTEKTKQGKSSLSYSDPKSSSYGTNMNKSAGKTFVDPSKFKFPKMPNWLYMLTVFPLLVLTSCLSLCFKRPEIFSNCCCRLWKKK